jgi:DeoR/GlpR family transcriptional regulator of sugar metabolism
MGKKTEAQQKILKLLQRCGELGVADAVAALNVSEATVRRHFAELESQGSLIRVFGGVRLPVADDSVYLFQSRAVDHLREKRAIGRVAAALICGHERLFCDSGTTVLEFGNALAGRFVPGGLSDITVITNSLVYSEELPQRCQVMLTGGLLRPARKDLSGLNALQNIERYNFSRAVLGADGISPEGVLSTTDEDTSLLAAAALRRSKEALILIDSSKLGIPSFVEYGTLDPGKFTLVTDSGADKSLVSKWRESGISVIVAENKP